MSCEKNKNISALTSFPVFQPILEFLDLRLFAEQLPAVGLHAGLVFADVPRKKESRSV
jgi:hypothetical protein